MTDEQSTSRNAAQPRYGRRPPKAAPALRLASLLSGTLPPTPTAVDYGKRFTGWQLLGNDSAGDCVAVSWANQRALVTTVLAEHTSYPSQDQVWQLYKTQNPQFDPAGSPSSTGPGSPADQGMEIQSALEYLVKTGGPDGVKAAAFAKVDHTDEAELRAAHAIFGQVWYGVNVQKANQSEFSGGKPWDYVAASPIEGGHSITGVGYDPKDYRFVTWARETMWTEAFRKHLVEEAWVVVWPEHFGAKEFQAGIDLGELAGAYQAITGRPLDVPTPTPVPVQASWRVCTKCDALVLAGGTTGGACAGGGSHDTAGSAEYDVAVKSSKVPGVVDLSDVRQPAPREQPLPT